MCLAAGALLRASHLVLGDLKRWAAMARRDDLGSPDKLHELGPEALMTTGSLLDGFLFGRFKSLVRRRL